MQKKKVSLELNEEEYNLESWRKLVAEDGVKKYLIYKGISVTDTQRWFLEDMLFETLKLNNIRPKE
jgi:hypothetical protein